MSESPAAFLRIPLELRLIVYDFYLTQHLRVSDKRQPTNEHIRVLHTCRQIEQEAGPTFRTYVSLRHERQIRAFVLQADRFQTARIQRADVANDGRVSIRVIEPVEPHDKVSQEFVPLSNLHLALRQMISLKRLRIFQCRQGLPVNLQRLHGRIALKFESAMYPSGCTQEITSYELHLDADTRVSPFEAIPPQLVHALRLSGDCHLPATPWTPALRHATIFGVTGNYFDQHTLDECFPGSALVSFTYVLGHRLGFELRDRHLHSLVRIAGTTLRTLVLLRCTRLSSAVVAACLKELPYLEYFALSLVTVDELQTNFVYSLGPAVSVLKLQVNNAWYAVPQINGERAICDALEELVLWRPNKLDHVAVGFRYSLMEEGGRAGRWESIASNRSFLLDIGPWEDNDIDDI